jgi:transposase
VVDALGNPVRLVLSPGQAHEIRFASELLSGFFDAYVAGDSAYSSRALAEQLEAQGCTVVIPSNPTHAERKIDKHLYKERHLVENFFQRIKRLRRIAMRFEKLARNFLGFLYLAAALVWLF